MIRLVLWFLPFFPLSLGGCGGETISPSCREATLHSDFAWINANILQPSCANFSSCHDAVLPKEMLDLTTDAAYAELVSVPSQQVPALHLVEPGDPPNSYLMIKLGLGAPDPRLADMTGLMPLGQNDLFCQEKVDAIERWILAGAAQ